MTRPTDEWGDNPPLCVTRCMHVAELLCDGEPYCIDCADLWFERILAIELRPELRELLPSLGKHDVVRPWRKPERVPSDSDPLRALGKAWALSPFNPANGAPDRNAGRAGRPPRRESPELASPRVTPDEPHEPRQARPAGQLSLLADP